MPFLWNVKTLTLYIKILGIKSYFVDPPCELFIPISFVSFSQKSDWLRVSLVFKTLLSNLTDFNSVIVWMTPVLPMISILLQPLEIVSSTLTTIGISVTFIFDRLFIFLKSFKYLPVNYFAFFDFHFVVCWNGKIYYKKFFSSCVWSSGRDWVIRLYLKISEKYKCLFFLHKWSLAILSFVSMVNF